ncbi:MAG TPA: hypothetical protein VEI04_00200 [Syntrophobacteria bacterium]|nr:hypothetical protein [Syntrophobacteria bacterium]
MDPIGQVEPPRMNTAQWLVVIAVDLLVLAELAIAMYMAAGDPDHFTPTFLKTFFGLLIPTLIVGVLAKRVVRPASERIKS